MLFLFRDYWKVWGGNNDCVLIMVTSKSVIVMLFCDSVVRLIAWREHCNILVYIGAPLPHF